MNNFKHAIDRNKQLQYGNICIFHCEDSSQVKKKNVLKGCHSHQVDIVCKTRYMLIVSFNIYYLFSKSATGRTSAFNRELQEKKRLKTKL